MSALGESVTLWSVRIALVCYAVALGLRWGKRAPNPGRIAAARYWWTAGCISFLLHVAGAFAWFHHWSHADAYASTAFQTWEFIGFRSGAGLYLNYFFTLVWTVDCACWWRAGDEKYTSRSRAIEGAIQGFMAFMAFNGAVVFAHGGTRWVSLAAAVVLTMIILRARRPA